LSKYTTEAGGSWQSSLLLYFTYCLVSRVGVLVSRAQIQANKHDPFTNYHILSKEGESGHSPRIMQLVTEVEAMLACFYAAPRGQLAAVLMDMYCQYAHLGDTASAARIYSASSGVTAS
jgi:hypothetical protein